MTKYLVNLGMFYQPKNKLHKAVQGFIGEQKRKVIPADQLKDYKSHLGREILSLNKHFPKCTPVNFNFWKSDIDENLHIENVVSLSMLKFEEEEKL